MQVSYEREILRQNARTDVPVGHIPAHRWYLERDAPHEVLPRPTPQARAISIVRSERPSLEFYRFLYNAVGEAWLWADRRRLSDDALLTDLSHPGLELHVLYEAGTPAGFFELVFDPEGKTALDYFGLLPSFVGRGLGGYLLNRSIVRAGERSQATMTVNTCTLDHPLALANYMRYGFQVVAEDDYSYPDPRLDGTIPRSAAPHVPLAA